MNIRRLTSLTALVSFIFVVITSVVLYIMPHGRTAYWINWRFWGLSKDQWGNIHINLGLLFLLALLLHIYYNWKPITSYLKNKSKELKIFTPECSLALLLCLVFTLGTLLSVPPFSSILEFSESLKEAASQKYGDPPWGHAELSPLNTFAKKMGWNPQQALTVLTEAGFQVEDPKQTLKVIAGDNGVSPQKLYLALQAKLGDAGTDGASGLPDTPPGGFGIRTLEEISKAYNVPLDALLRALKAKNIQAAPEQNIKAIAAGNELSPYEVFDILKTAEK